MPEQDTKGIGSTQLRAAVMKSARGVTVALRHTSGIIPAPMLEAVVTAGRVSYETICAIAVADIISDTTTVRLDIQAELDRLDKERADALSSNGEGV